MSKENLSPEAYLGGVAFIILGALAYTFGSMAVHPTAKAKAVHPSAEASAIKPCTPQTAPLPRDLVKVDFKVPLETSTEKELDKSVATDPINLAKVAKQLVNNDYGLIPSSNFSALVEVTGDSSSSGVSTNLYESLVCAEPDDADVLSKVGEQLRTTVDEAIAYILATQTAGQRLGLNQ